MIKLQGKQLPWIWSWIWPKKLRYSFKTMYANPFEKINTQMYLHNSCFRHVFENVLNQAHGNNVKCLTSWGMLFNNAWWLHLPVGSGRISSFKMTHIINPAHQSSLFFILQMFLCDCGWMYQTNAADQVQSLFVRDALQWMNPIEIVKFSKPLQHTRMFFSHLYFYKTENVTYTTVISCTLFFIQYMHSVVEPLL